MNVLKINAPVVVQHPKDVHNWILAQKFDCGDGKVIPRGFVTDFASIPRLFWNIITPTELGDAGPVEHDWDYRNKIGPRKRADLRLMAHMKKQKIPWWKRQAAYQLVRLWGWNSWGKSKVVIEAIQLQGEVLA